MESNWPHVNTQKKIFNAKRRTYIDSNDCKEGEVICKKCKGKGENASEDGPWCDSCSQCFGNGIVDWVTQAVERPPLILDSSSCSSVSSCSVITGMSGISGTIPKPQGPKNTVHIGMIAPKGVTNYKRRKIV